MNREQRRRAKEPREEDKEGKLKYSSGLKNSTSSPKGNKGNRTLGPYRLTELATLLPASVFLLGVGIYNAFVNKASGPGFFSIMIGVTGFTALALRLVPRRKHWLLLAAWTAAAVVLIVLLNKI